MVFQNISSDLDEERFQLCMVPLTEHLENYTLRSTPDIIIIIKQVFIYSN